ncbi:outer-membrane lipoprotein carrier protein LolA [Ancylobacter lacus]|uniref:outer-membrane lipoprotein carrier protein LolA n=1 Tax=Ancylobacter lacus TaxID=2579970 RepID=UPI001FEC947E|nr:outer-membrane lipoprotein carrier protein LolA [Ancylobacter lacus]
MRLLATACVLLMLPAGSALAQQSPNEFFEKLFPWTKQAPAAPAQTVPPDAVGSAVAPAPAGNPYPAAAAAAPAAAPVGAAASPGTAVPAARQAVVLPETGPRPVPAPLPKETGRPVVAAAPAPAPAHAGNPAPANPAPAAPAAVTPVAEAPASAAPAAPAEPVQLAAAPSQQAPAVTIDRINRYFNSFKTMTGDFVQIDPSGARQRGEFYILKPGRVLFEYAPPSQIVLVADGRSVSIRDKRLKTQDISPLSQTPLRFLLSENLDLARNANVVGVYQDDVFATVVLQETQPMVGTYRLMIMFDAKTMQLKQWTVTDPQGYDTTVAVSNLNTREQPDPALFVINR